MTAGTAPSPFQVDRQLFPFESRYLRTRDGATVHYVAEGAGDVTLLMLHGNPTWSFLYRHLIAGLRDQVRCIALDHPGFGLSVAPPGYDFSAARQHQVVAEVVERLGLDRVVLVVQDWGGPIGLALAADRPDLVAGIIAGNTWAWPLRGDRRMATFSRIMGGPIGRTRAVRFNGVWRFFMRRGFRQRPPAEVMAMFEAPFREGDRTPTSVFPRELVAAEELERRAERGLAAVGDVPALCCGVSTTSGSARLNAAGSSRPSPDTAPSTSTRPTSGRRTNPRSLWPRSDAGSPLTPSWPSPAVSGASSPSTAVLTGRSPDVHLRRDGVLRKVGRWGSLTRPERWTRRILRATAPPGTARHADCDGHDPRRRRGDGFGVGPGTVHVQRHRAR